MHHSIFHIPYLLSLTPKRGVALIIVIFAMMLFAVLGVTLAVMQSGDFEVNLRNLDSERALGLAEAGTQWLLNQLITNPTGVIKGTHYIHTLNFGQYDVYYRDPIGTESGGMVIVSTGYIPKHPTQGQYRAMRIVKLMVSFGAIDKAVNCRYLFDWTAMHGGSYIKGDIVVTDRPDPVTGDGYEGDGDYTEHSTTADRAVPPLPPPAYKRDTAPNDDAFLLIDMNLLEQEAIDHNDVWAPARAGEITDITTVGGKSVITVNANIFNAIPQSQFDTQYFRNTTMGHWQNGSWGEIDTNGVEANNRVRLTTIVDWKVGDRVHVVPRIPSVPAPAWDNGSKTYAITVNCNLSSPTALARYDAIRNVSSEIRNSRFGIWDYRDWGYVSANPNFAAGSTTFTLQLDSTVPSNPGWLAGDALVQVKRFYNNTNNEIWYIKGDVLFDARSGGFNCNTSTFTAEGDIGIVGSGRIKFKAHNSRSANFTYPNIATQNGNIYSRSGDREFDGLVYSGTGDVFFDGITGVSIYGWNITLDGSVQLTYTTKRVDEDAFFPGISYFSWQEVESQD